MCQASDIAMTMINKSIELARTEYNSSYYMDFVKLHKLMYLAQCYMLSQYDSLLFEDRIVAHQCGPYVEGIHFIPKMRGFQKILKPFPLRSFVLPSYRRINVIDFAVKNAGKFSRDTLIQYTKSTAPYRLVEAEITDTFKPEITVESMKNFVAYVV